MSALDNPTGLAFFDFDNTLIHGDAGPLFGTYLVQDRYRAIKDQKGRREADRDRRRLLARYLPFIAWMGAQAALYKARAVRRSRLVRSAYKALRGLPAESFYGLMDEFVDQEIPDRIYPVMRETIDEHQKAGRACVVVTTGIEALVVRALRLFPAGVEVIGCQLEETDGRLTGAVEGPLYGADKANILTAYAKASDVDLADCYAYSDHYSDYHMLDAVGHPVCVNPRGRLARMADDRGWEVLRLPDPRLPDEA